MQQAARVADMTAFFSVEVREDGTGRQGVLVEYDATTKIFTNPSDKRTEDYVTGPIVSADGQDRIRPEPGLAGGWFQELGQSSCALRGALNALETQDVELCDEVIAFDDEIDALYHDIENGIEALLAQQTPVASDLRPCSRSSTTLSTSSASATSA